MNILGIEIERLNHACFKLKTDKIVYFDPYEIEENEKADLILISHEHFDHLSLPDLEKLLKEDTIIVTIPDCQSKLSRIADKIKEVKLVTPNQEIQVNGFKIETIPAYNTNKFRSPGVTFHPKQDERIGFIITINGKKIYFAGDTDVIPEMQTLKDIDIALLPISGTYVMTPEEAAVAADTIKAEITIPMHYKSKTKAETFKSLAKESKVIIL